MRLACDASVLREIMLIRLWRCAQGLLPYEHILDAIVGCRFALLNESGKGLAPVKRKHATRLKKSLKHSMGQTVKNVIQGFMEYIVNRLDKPDESDIAI